MGVENKRISSVSKFPWLHLEALRAFPPLSRDGNIFFIFSCLQLIFKCDKDTRITANSSFKNQFHQFRFPSLKLEKVERQNVTANNTNSTPSRKNT